jgi:hypothetical protein
MFREIPQEACGWKDIKDTLKRLDRLMQEEALMAAAQILNLTHRVDNKVTGIGNQVTGVGNKLKDVDNKMDILVQGMPCVGHSFTIHSILIALCWLDGKGMKVALQQMSNNIDDVKCS